MLHHNAFRPVLSLILTLVIAVLPLISVQAQSAAPSVTLTCSQTSAAVGDTLTFTLTGTHTAAVRLMIVTPDSRQTFLTGEQVSYTIQQPGLHTFIAFGTTTTDTSSPDYQLCMSGQLVLDCAAAASSLCPLCGTDIQSIVTYAQEHPHPMTYSCECGAQKQDTSSFVCILSCCECAGHRWSDPVRLPDGSFIQLCCQCNASQSATPSDSLAAFYKVIDILQETRKHATAYQETYEVDEYAFAIWKIIARQATQKLTEKGFVYTTEALNTFSDMADSIVGCFTQESWDAQQTGLWKSMLIQMLREQQQALGDTRLFDKAADWSDQAAAFADGAKDISEMAGEAFADNAQVLSKAISDMDAWLLELEQQANMLDRAGNWEASNAIRNKWFQLKQLQSQYHDDLLKQTDNGHFASAAEKSAKDIGFAMTMLSLLAEGTSSAQEMAQRNNAFADMVINGQKNLEILEQIIQASGNNSNLRQAATQLKEELAQEMERQTNQFLSETGAFITTFFTEGSKKIAEEGFDFLVEQAAKQSGCLLGAAGVAVKDALFILSIVELGAKGLKMIVNWGEAYNQAQLLMTLCYMDATMNVLDVLRQDHSQYMAQLWAVLQTRGCENARIFLQQWEDANWLSTKEFGIGKKLLPDVMDLLKQEENIYQSAF